MSPNRLVADMVSMPAVAIIYQVVWAPQHTHEVTIPRLAS